MSFRVGSLKNGWALYRRHDNYYPRGNTKEGIIVYKLFRDVMSIDDVVDDITGERPVEHSSKGGKMYSMLITIDVTLITKELMPVKFEVGELFEHSKQEFSHLLKQDPEPSIPGSKNIVIPFKTYELLVKNYATLEEYISWKKYEAAKIRYDKTKHQDFTVSGENLLFPCERDVRKIIVEEEQRLRVENS